MDVDVSRLAREVLSIADDRHHPIESRLGRIERAIATAIAESNVEVVHASVLPWQSRCGDDYPNMRTTSVEANVTCGECRLLKRPPQTCAGCYSHTDRCGQELRGIPEFCCGACPSIRVEETMQCEPGCDSQMRTHDEFCPVAHPAAAWRRLRTELAELRALAGIVEASRICHSCREVGNVWSGPGMCEHHACQIAQWRESRKQS